MFHWICPECGQEIAPTARECPVCDPPAAQAELALAGVVEAPAARPDHNAVPVARALREAAPAARARQVAPPKDNEGGVVQRAGESTSACIAEEPLPQFGSTDESPDPLAALAATLEGLAPAIPSSKSNPPGPRSVPMALRALIAELGTGAAPPRLPLNGSLHPNSAAEPPLSRDKLSMPLPAPIDDATRPFGAKLLPLAWAMAKPEAPGTPQLGLAPSLASLTHYNPLDGHPLRPSQPLRNVRKTDCGPRLTLAGPTLPPALLRFEDRVFNPIPATSWKPRKRFLPGWAMTASIACTVLVAGINGVFSGSRPATPPPPAQVEAAPSEAVPPPPPPNTASPLAKAIEVTGLRIEMSPEKKSEIRYLVVNHTANELGGLTVYVTLHGGHAPAGQPALGRFQFTLPKLTAYQSKEMSAAIERVTRPISLPEWQDLRADIEIGQ